MGTKRALAALSVLLMVYIYLGAGTAVSSVEKALRRSVNMETGFPEMLEYGEQAERCSMTYDTKFPSTLHLP